MEPVESYPPEPVNGSWVQVAGAVYERDDVARHMGYEPNWFNMYAASDGYIWTQLVDLARSEGSEIWLMGMTPVEEIKL